MITTFKELVDIAAGYYKKYYGDNVEAYCSLELFIDGKTYKASFAYITPGKLLLDCDGAMIEYVVNGVPVAVLNNVTEEE